MDDDDDDDEFPAAMGVQCLATLENVRRWRTTESVCDDGGEPGRRA